MKTLVLALTLALSPTVALSDFKSDMTIQDLREWTGEVILGDLAVGEIGYFISGLCWLDGQLFAKKEAVLVTQETKSLLGYKIIRIPQNKVSVEAIAGERLEESYFKDRLATLLNDQKECNSHRNKPYLPQDLLAVDNINGMESSTELIRYFFP